MNDYLAHYGVKGMKWGKRKAIFKKDTRNNQSQGYMDMRLLGSSSRLYGRRGLNSPNMPGKAEIRRRAGKRGSIAGSAGISGSRKAMNAMRTAVTRTPKERAQRLIQKNVVTPISDLAAGAKRALTKNGRKKTMKYLGATLSPRTMAAKGTVKNAVLGTVSAFEQHKRTVRNNRRTR